MLPRVCVTLAVLFALAAARDARGANVASFTSAKIEIIGGPGPPLTVLDLDPDNPPHDAMRYSVTLGRVAMITITGTTIAQGDINVGLLEDDVGEAFRGRDDELDDRITGFSYAPGEEFEIRVYCDCTPQGELGGIEQAGEQSGEVYAKDGDKRIPAARTLPDGSKMRSWWQIDCDKETSANMLPSGGTLGSVWSDTLRLPPGALPAPTNVQMSNMYPLLNLEAVPAGFLPISEALTLQPHGLPLQVPGQLDIQYTQEEVGEMADEQTLAMFRHDPQLQQWLPVPGAVVDQRLNRIKVPISQFATYGFAARIPDGMIAQQAVGTDFLDNTLGQHGFSNGSELDVMRAILTETDLYMVIAGNLESDFTKLEVFFDCIPGGQNRLRGNNPNLDSDGLNRMGDDGSGNGFTFDPGFNPDFWLGLTGGDVGGGVYRLSAYYATLPTAGGGIGHYLGATEAFGEGFLKGGTNPDDIRVAIDNSNTLGVTAGCQSANPGPVSTGFQLVIPRAALGFPTGCILICAFVNAAGHDYVSNQFLGPLPQNTCNRGEPRAVNLGHLLEIQATEVCPPIFDVGVEPRVAASASRVLAWPNPFRGDLSLRIDAPDGSAVRVEFYDLAGRAIKRFSERRAGSMTFVWDGRADDGTSVPAGIYLVRVRGQGFDQTVRVLRLP